MGVRFTHTFYSEKGTEYTVKINDSLFSGVETEVRALNGGFKIQYTSESDDINEPIKASSCTFNMLVENSSIETYITDLVSRPYGDIHMRIEKGGSIYWAGTINTSLIKLEHTSFPYAIEFNAVDGLGELQNLTFNDANLGILTEGNRFKLSQFFADLLNACGNTIDFGTSSLFTTASPLYETQSPTTDDVFNRTYLYTSAFTDQNGNYNLNYHQVLKQILIGFNCRIMVSDGIYRIIDNRFYDYYTSWKEYVYNSSGVQQSSSTFNNSVAYGSSRIFLADPIIEFDPALKIVEAKQIADYDIRINPKQAFNLAYGSSGSLLFAVRRQPILGVDASAYGFSSLKGGTNKKLRLEFVIDNKGIDPNKIKYINVIIQVSNGSASKRLSNTYNSFTGINNTTKNVDPYKWVTPSTSQGVNLLFSQGKKGKYVIDLPDLPYTDCSIEYFAFMLMGDYDIIRSGNIFNSSYNITNLDCTNIVAGMVVQDFDVPGRIQVSPAVTLTTVTASQKLAVMNTLYTGAAGFRNIGFLISANDIIAGDESLVSLEVTSFSYLPDGVNQDNEGYIYTSTNDDVVTEKYELDPVYFGDGFNIQNKNTLYVSNSFGTILPSSAWTIKPSFEVQNSAALLQKLTQSVLWHQYKALKRYNGTIFTTGYEPHQAIIKGSEKLVFVGGEFVAEMDEWSGSWAVWQYRPDAYVSSSKGNGSKASNVDITKDIYPKVDIWVLDNDLKLIGDVIGSMGGALAMYRQSVMDAEKIAFDYIGVDPQFKIQVTGATITATSYKEDDTFMTAENGKFWKVINGTITQTFQAAAAGSGITTIGTIDSQTKSSNGLVISGSNLVAQTADATNVGMVSIGTQTFAGAKTFNNGALSSVVITSSNYSAGSGSHISITPNITANANNATINAVSINPTLSAGAFTGVTLVDLALTRNNPNINIGSGNLAFMAAQTTQMVIRSASGGVTMLKSKIGSVTGAATNVLDVGGDSLFSAAASTPATASARVHIVGSGTSSGTALLVTNSTPTTIIKADNNQDLYLGSSGGKVGFFAVTPIVRPTTAGAAATYVSGGGGTNIKTDDTFDGYSVQQVVRALKNLGLLT